MLLMWNAGALFRAVGINVRTAEAGNNLSQPLMILEVL